MVCDVGCCVVRANAGFDQISKRRRQFRAIKRAWVLVSLSCALLFASAQLSFAVGLASPTITATLETNRTITISGSQFLGAQAVRLNIVFGAVGTINSEVLPDTNGAFAASVAVPSAFSGKVTVEARQKKLPPASRTTTASSIPANGAATTLTAAPAALRTPGQTGERPIALVMNGQLNTCDDCAEAFGAMLESSAWNFEVIYVGPRGVPLTPELLATAALYGQPGQNGDDADAAFREMAPYVDMVREYVQNGGRYLGVCMGGYFAGKTMFDLIPNGTTGQYIATSGASVRSLSDQLVQVDFRGSTRQMFFQDGNYMEFDPSTPGSEVIATFTNGKIAAGMVPFGKGKVATAGPHPEARQNWFDYAGLSDPDGVDYDIGHALIDSVMK